MQQGYLITIVGASLAMWGCGGAPQPSITEANNHSEAASYLMKSCQRTNGTSGPAREGASHQSSSVALARDASGLVAYVADRDRDRLVVVDLTSRAIRSTVRVHGAPEQVIVLADGRVVVSIGNSRIIEAFEPADIEAAPLSRLCAREVPAGPYALATSPDDQTLVVTSAWEPALSIFDTDLTPKSAAPLARAPRGVLVDAANHAFVSHLVGNGLSVIDLNSSPRSVKSVSLSLRAGSPGSPDESLNVDRRASQAYSLASVTIEPPPRHSESAASIHQSAGLAHSTPSQKSKVEAPPRSVASTRIVVPMVSVDPGDQSRPNQNYYGPPAVAGVPKQAPVAALIDPISGTSLTTHVVPTTGGARGGECLLPRASVAHPNEPLLYVACLGVDQVLELDARSADPMRTVRRRFKVPIGPTGVAIAGKENMAVVFSQFDDSLTLIPLGESLDNRTRTISLRGGEIPVNSISLDPRTSRGRELFYRSDNNEVSSDGLACSSCHPDGTEDGLTWSTPEGPRQTPMLAGRLGGTAPYGWTRHQPGLESYISDTCERLGGTGLSHDELDDLSAYLSALDVVPRNSISKLELVATGRALFRDRGCVECHVGEIGTDAKSHQFSTHLSDEPVDTPSLRDVGVTAPYFHDGRYATLDVLLSDKTSMMGNTARLTPQERTALQAFLGSL